MTDFRALCAELVEKNVTMDPDSPNWWSLESIEYIETEPYWLPHWALPVPKVNNTGKTND